MNAAASSLPEIRQQLKVLIRERAFKQNSLFRTPEKMVESYFDFLEVSLKHRGVELAGELVHNELKDLDIQAVGGPNHGIASILCRVAYLMKIGVFYVRDSIKKEGNLNDPKWIESRIQGGDRVALVGDVISSGGQMIRAIEAVMELGGDIRKMVIVIDSQEGDGLARINRFLCSNMLEIPISVLFTREEIVGSVP